MPLVRVLQAMPRVMSSVRVVLVALVVSDAASDGVVDGVSRDPLVARVLLLMVPGVCPCLVWRRLVGLLVYGLWWRWLSLVPGVASGDANGGMVLAMVFLMPLAWVV